MLTIQHSTLNTQRPLPNIQHLTFNTQHSTFNTQHPTSNIRHSAALIQHSTLTPPVIQHSTSNIHCLRTGRDTRHRTQDTSSRQHHPPIHCFSHKASTYKVPHTIPQRAPLLQFLASAAEPEASAASTTESTVSYILPCINTAQCA